MVQVIKASKLKIILTCFMILMLNGCIGTNHNTMNNKKMIEMGVNYPDNHSYKVNAENIQWNYDKNSKFWYGTIQQFQISLNGKSYSDVKGFFMQNDFQFVLLANGSKVSNLPLDIRVYAKQKPSKLIFTHTSNNRAGFAQITNKHFKFDNKNIPLNISFDYEERGTAYYTPIVIIHYNKNNVLKSKQISERNNNNSNQKNDVYLKFNHSGYYNIKASISSAEWKETEKSNVYKGNLFTFRVKLKDINQNTSNFNNYGVYHLGDTSTISIHKSDLSRNPPLFVYIHGLIEKPKQLNFSINQKMTKNSKLPLSKLHFNIDSLRPTHIHFADGIHDPQGVIHPVVHLYFKPSGNIALKILTGFQDKQILNQVQKISSIQLIKNDDVIESLPFDSENIVHYLSKEQIPDAVLLKSFFGRLQYTKKSSSNKNSMVYNINTANYLKSYYIKERKNKKPLSNVYVVVTATNDQNNSSFSTLYNIYRKMRMHYLFMMTGIPYLYNQLFGPDRNDSHKSTVENKRQKNPVLFFGKSKMDGSISFFSWGIINEKYQVSVVNENIIPVVNHMPVTDTIFVDTFDRFQAAFHVKSMNSNALKDVLISLYFKNEIDSHVYTYLTSIKTNKFGVAVFNIPIVNSSYKYCDLVASKNGFYVTQRLNIPINEFNNTKKGVTMTLIDKSYDISLSDKRQIDSYKNSTIQLPVINDKKIKKSINQPQKDRKITADTNTVHTNTIPTDQQIFVILEQTAPDLNSSYKKHFSIAKKALSHYLQLINWNRKQWVKNTIKLSSAFTNRLINVSNIQQLEEKKLLYNTESKMKVQLNSAYNSFNLQTNHQKKIIYIVTSRRSFIAPPTFMNDFRIDLFNQKNISISFITIGEEDESYSSVLDDIAARSTNGRVYNCHSQEMIETALTEIILGLSI